MAPQKHMSVQMARVLNRRFTHLDIIYRGARVGGLWALLVGAPCVSQCACVARPDGIIYIDTHI